MKITENIHFNIATGIFSLGIFGATIIRITPFGV